MDTPKLFGTARKLVVSRWQTFKIAPRGASTRGRDSKVGVGVEISTPFQPLKLRRGERARGLRVGIGILPNEFWVKKGVSESGSGSIMPILSNFKQN